MKIEPEFDRPPICKDTFHILVLAVAVPGEFRQNFDTAIARNDVIVIVQPGEARPELPLCHQNGLTSLVHIFQIDEKIAVGLS